MSEIINDISHAQESYSSADIELQDGEQADFNSLKSYIDEAVS